MKKEKKKEHSVEFESFFCFICIKQEYALLKETLQIENSLLVSIACTKMMFYGF